MIVLILSFFLACSSIQTMEAVPSHDKSVQSDSDWYRSYDIKFFKIDIEATDTSTYIAANVTILSQALVNLDSFTFELADNIIIDSILVDQQQRVNPVRSGDIVTVPLSGPIQNGQTIAITVYYKGTVKASGFFSPLSNKRDNTWGIPVTWSLSEPFGAKQWLPCKQYLPDKIDSAWIFITVPENCKAGSNGILTDITYIAPNKHRFEWKTLYPMAYYQLSLSVADYSDYSFYARLNDTDSVLVQNFIYNRIDYLEKNKTLIDRAADYLKFYSSSFGTYPFRKEKYGHCLAPLGGGMEHQTMTTLSDFNGILVVHEMAHQWFGNLVTCATWQDIWINEGFASYGEYLTVGAFEPDEKAVNWMKDAHHDALYYPEGSVFIPAGDRQNELRIFNNSLTYKKGAAIIHMLRFELNNDNLFFSILRRFLSDYKFSVATGQDFLKVLNKLSKADYTWFLDQWYYGKGYPEFDLSWKATDHTVTLTSNQKSSSVSTPFFKMHFELKLISNNWDTIVRLYQGQPQETFSIPVTRDIDSIQFDPGEWLLNTVTIDKVPDLPSFDDYFQASPVPFSDELTVRFKSEPENDRILKLMDLNGNIEIEQKIKKKIEVTLNTCKLSDKVYLLTILDGNKKYTRKVMKLK